MAAKILVVDDEPDIRFLVGYYLRAQGYQVVHASSGREALVQAQAEQPDLIILDVLMPGMTGIEVCAALRRNPATATARIVLFSALAQDSDRQKGIDAGADEYLSKPINLQEMAARVRALLALPPRAAA